jgi:ribonuclease HII
MYVSNVICGVDEAGKGSVLGPMVIAGVGVKSPDVFLDIPVKDSKKLTPATREALYTQIKKRCRIATVVIEAHEIDAFRLEMTMNAVVARAHAEVIRKISPDIAYVDACDVNSVRYGQTVKEYVGGPCEIVSEHHVDDKFPVVSAASIIAKVTRDRAITKLAKTYGNIGSGYPSDPDTVHYLTTYIDEHTCPPPIARKSWKTVISMIAKKEQSSLQKFF